MNKIMNIIVVVAMISLTIITKSLIYLIVLSCWMAVKQIKKILKKNQSVEEVNKTMLNEFHTYLKIVILLTYTRPLKNAFVDANNINNKKLKKRINKFIGDIQYDFTIDPYKNLAMKINPTKSGINYEVNIMLLLYELEKKGLGSDYINDVLVELDLLIENQITADIEQLRDNSYMYTLPPTIINFFYLTIVLFNVINLMIESILKG